jgi:hypothetical protein
MVISMLTVAVGMAVGIACPTPTASLLGYHLGSYADDSG